MNFWKSWENKTEMEIKYIIEAENFIPVLIDKFPKEIKSIFIHGSFATREIIAGSDVDFDVVVEKKNQVRKVREFINSYKKDKVVDGGCYSIEALLLGEKDFGSVRSAGFFLFLAKYYKLVYGEPLDYSQLKPFTPEECLERFTRFVLAKREEYISRTDPYHKQLIAKFFLWITYFRMLINGYEGFLSYDLIKKEFPKNSIEHKAVLVRERRGKNTPDDFIKSAYENMFLLTDK